MSEQEISLREIQLEELEILKSLVKYIDKNNLKYFICGGTLLGAVRHKGFIPWDDDIDLFMPREDYTELFDLLKNEKLNENLEAICYENGNSFYPYGKIINKKIVIEGSNSIDKYLSIDVFPLDVYPEDLEECKKIVEDVQKYKRLHYLRITTCKSIMSEKKSLMNRLSKVLIKPFISIHSIKYYCKKIIDVLNSVDQTKPSDYYGVIVWGYGIKERFDKTVFEDSVLVDFEGEKFKAPIKYKDYLTSLYGSNYMKLPPKEKQVTHSIKARKVL